MVITVTPRVDDNLCRKRQFCTTGLPSDVVIEVGDMTFHLHKFPLMSRSKKLHDLITNRESRGAGAGAAAAGGEEEDDADAGEIREEEEEAAVVLEADEDSDVHRIRLPDFPGGAEAFEQAAKFCYGVKLDLTPATAAPLRCAAERLGMSDDHSDDNLVSRADRFISHTVLRNPRDAIRALRSCEPLLPLADDLGLVSRCVDALAAKAASSTPTALFGWPITTDAAGGGGGDRPRRKNNASAGAGATWFDDLAGLSLATFTRVIAAMKERGVGPEIIEGALIAYAKRSIPGLSRSGRHVTGGGGGTAPPAPSSDGEQKALLETVIANLPVETIKSTAHTGTSVGATTARVLFGLLRTASILHASESARDMLERRIAARLPDAAVDDLLVPSYSYLVETLYDVDCVERIVRYFLEGRGVAEDGNDDGGSEPESPGRDATRRAMLAVGRLMDAYLGEIAADANLKPDKFCDLAWALPDGARVYDDGLYRAVDIYLKAHPGLREEEKEKVSGVVDGRKLTLEACTHAAQNERLPLRTVVQVLFFEQLQLRRAIARTIMANEGGGAADQGEEEGESDAGGTWRVATRGNQMLRLDMDSMRNRVQELERECTSMRKAIEKMDRRGGGSSTPGERGATPAMEGRWGSMVTKRFGCKFPAHVCQSQQRTVVARPRRPRIEQSP
uniref:NPH3 domain-containing protein n=1 Tax=Leersia perrieri TaxID=77586 RepID=A0A0D9VZG6_9ORYZ